MIFALCWKKIGNCILSIPDFRFLVIGTSSGKIHELGYTVGFFFQTFTNFDFAAADGSEYIKNALFLRRIY